MITDNLRDIQSQYGIYSPTLIAVSKQQSDDKIEEALSCGLRIFGENRVQEAQLHWQERRKRFPDLQLHLIGPLQTNKAKAACALFDIIHTLDREKLAHEIIKYRPEIPCFIQVNTGNEEQKAGISLNKLDDFYKFCCDLGMNIIGLMCIPPVDEAPANHFKLLHDSAKKLRLPSLSMGMSGDFETALKHGATHIRIGSKLFGTRHK